MISYLGGINYDVIMRCLKQEGTFTAFDVGAHPQRVKKLAAGGMLQIVEKRRVYPRRPYSYRVPEEVRRRFQDTS